MDRFTAGSRTSASGPSPPRSAARPRFTLDLRGLFLTEDGAPGEAMAGDALHISAEGKRRWKEQVLRWTEQHLR